MAEAPLAKIVVIGVPQTLEAAEDTITALRCMDVTDARQGETHFEIAGWVPQTWFDELSGILEEATEGRAIVTIDEGARRAEAPVLLKNPKLAQPFEVLVEMFSLPGRDDFDPTRITSLFLPLFFGFIIGDAGYGLVLVWAAWIVHRRVPTPVGALTSRILALGGAWAMLVGLFVFQEAFAFGFGLPLLDGPLLDRHVDIMALLALSIGVGLAHVALGLFIGFRDERRRAGLRVAVLRKASWLMIEAGAILLALDLLGSIAGVAKVWALAILGTGILLVALGGGMTDVIEIPSFLTSILSYVRLGALGIAEALLGGVINDMAAAIARSDGWLAWGLAAVALALGHATFLAFAVLVVTLQVVRLHYVEFYPRFYRLDEGPAPKPFEAVTTAPE